MKQNIAKKVYMAQPQAALAQSLLLITVTTNKLTNRQNEAVMSAGCYC